MFHALHFNVFHRVLLEMVTVTRPIIESVATGMGVTVVNKLFPVESSIPFQIHATESVSVKTRTMCKTKIIKKM